MSETNLWAWYSDPDVLRRERERIFRSAWHYVGHAGRLSEEPSYFACETGGVPAVVTRDAGGELRAFLNICRHRGAQICTEDSGAVKRAFQCPYHAWTYDLEGKLIAAPNLTKMPDIDRVEYGLVPVALREWLGYAWVCLAKEPPSFEDDVVVRGARDGLRARVRDRLQLLQAPHLVDEPLGRLHLEHRPQLRRGVVEPFHAEREAHAPLGSELVDQERLARVLRLLEEQRRAARLDGAVDDLGHFEVRVDLGGNANELAFALEERDPLTQVGGGAHPRSSLRRACRRSV